MKAIKINNNFVLYGVEFRKELFLTDSEVVNILNQNPRRCQGFYTVISKVTNLHAQKLQKLFEKISPNHTHYHFITIYDI